MPNTTGNGYSNAQPEKPAEWLSDLMACYDCWDWRVADECPEVATGVRLDDERAITDALMRYYNHS